MLATTFLVFLLFFFFQKTNLSKLIWKITASLITFLFDRKASWLKIIFEQCRTPWSPSKNQSRAKWIFDLGSDATSYCCWVKQLALSWKRSRSDSKSRIWGRLATVWMELRGASSSERCRQYRLPPCSWVQLSVVYKALNGWAFTAWRSAFLPGRLQGNWDQLGRCCRHFPPPVRRETEAMSLPRQALTYGPLCLPLANKELIWWSLGRGGKLIF